VPRNQEVIRQWKLLHALESSRHGAAIDALADDLDVTTRTIRRDLAALQEAGFPLYDERDEEGHVHWRIDGQVLKGLDTGFTHLAAAFGRPTVGIYCDYDPGLAGLTGDGFVASLGDRGRPPPLEAVRAAFAAACDAAATAPQRQA